MIAISADPIDVARVVESVHDPSAGAVNIFIGTTRGVSEGRRILRLEYEAYEPMAVSCLNRIAQDAAAQWRVTRISVVHRTGVVPVGEASVVIAVSAPHRSDAFAACRSIIERVKTEVPIWKKEYYEGGAIWVELSGTGHPPGPP